MTNILPFKSPVKANSLHLRCTGVLNKKIDAILNPYTLCDNPLIDWHVHLFIHKRVQYMIYMNSATFFSYIFPARGINDEAKFIDTAPERIKEALTAFGFENVYDQVISKVANSFMLTKTADRTTIGTMNQLVRDAKFLIEYHDGDLQVVSKTLNETIVSAINNGWPIDAFTEMVNRYV